MNIDVTASETNTDMQQKLWDAAKAGDCATIRMLAMSGQVDVNAKNEDGFDAFNIATQAGKSDAATTILAAREVQVMREMGLIPEQQEAASKPAGKSAANNISGRKTA